MVLLIILQVLYHFFLPLLLKVPLQLNFLMVVMPCNLYRHCFFDPTLVLHEVLCVPSFHFNLIVVSKFTHTSNCHVIFYPDYCLMQDQTSRKMIGMNKEQNGLYHFVLNKLVCSFVSSPSVIWHRCLGHLSNKCLNLLLNYVPEICTSNIKHCDACPIVNNLVCLFLVALFPHMLLLN